MKLVSVCVKNFRCYQQLATARIDDLTTFIGKNDIGKSSILEALEIFFNGELVTIESGDANVYAEDKSVQITCEFSELPAAMALDATAQTDLASEYLLTQQRTLKIRKSFDCRSKKPSEEIHVLAHHPTVFGTTSLLELKEKELQAKIKEKKLDVPLKGNPGMRKALWAAEADLKLADLELPLSKMKEDGKRLWEQIESHLPLFALFQSDRSSRDTDGEVQQPMKAAVAAAIAEVQEEIEEIQRKVKEKAEEIARATHDALQTLDPNLARELTPQFAPPTAAKWTGLFGINMDTEDGIPLNKRGSGVRRLVLVSFFKAAAERKLKAGHRSIIYAIEEPETAQHPNNQKVLLHSLKALAAEDGYQVILTTHSPGLAAELPTESIRFISRDAQHHPTIDDSVNVFDQVARTLGVVADSQVRVLLCVEGPTDVQAFKCLSRALHADDQTLEDLSSSKAVAFIVLGGSTLEHWVAEHYLRGLGRPEVHIYDSDVQTYAASITAVNQRGDRSWGCQTQKYEIENYLHADVILAAFGVTVQIPDQLDGQGRAVPAIVAQAIHTANPVGQQMRDNTMKKRLAAQAFPLMTAALLRQRDPTGEVKGWMRQITAML